MAEIPDKKLIAFAAEGLLAEHSLKNSDFRKLRSLYLYSVGAQRQVFSVLSHTGFAEGYSNLVRRAAERLPLNGSERPSEPEQRSGDQAQPETNTQKPTSKRKPGSLLQLSEDCRRRAREAAATSTTATVYDNVNMRFNVAETTLAGKGEIMGC
jgi:hypothetical protein